MLLYLVYFSHSLHTIVYMTRLPGVNGRKCLKMKILLLCMCVSTSVYAHHIGVCISPCVFTFYVCCGITCMFVEAVFA